MGYLAISTENMMGYHVHPAAGFLLSFFDSWAEFFSCGEIENAEELGLVLEGYHETETGYWGVCSMR